ncbi:MAG: hypothetical protein JW990_17100 [Thermoleophilia bacterium]|nr:hypothetical protein [Thermoleophilia bacterium]
MSKSGMSTAARRVVGRGCPALPVLSILTLLVLLIGLGIGLAACDGSSPDSTATTTGAPPVETTEDAGGETTLTTVAEVDPLEWPMLAPTVIDVPAEEVVSAVISSQGGVVEYGPVRIEVPAGALSADTNLTITRLGGSFNDEPSGAAPEDVMLVRPIGSIYDFGPAGTRFQAPVTITLPYDPGMGPEAVDPKEIAVAYYNGEHWAMAGGTADPATHTVSVQVRTFEGVSARAVLKSMGPSTWLIGKAIDYEYGPEEEGVDTDPVYAGKASEWITPTDPVIQAQAAKAVLFDPSTDTTIALDDPALATWVESSVASRHMPVLGYQNPDGSVSVGDYDASKGSNWQKPSNFFTKGTLKGGALHGDCTDITCAAVSVFKAKGIPAKGVYGYADKDERRTHAWGEVLIGTKVYRIDEYGAIITPETGVDNFKTYQPPTDPDDPHYNSMWDENGQAPYDPEWWKQTNKFAGTYEGLGKGWLRSGDAVAEVPWELIVDGKGIVSGGWDYEWVGHSVSYACSFTGQVTEDGVVTATGTMTLTSLSGKGSSSGGMSLEGRISGKIFTGKILSSTPDIEVQAQRR